MRKHRTNVFEDLFIDSLNRLHAVRPSHFTSSLLKSFDTFLQSKTDSILKRPTFSALVKGKSIDLTSCCPSTQLGIKAKVIITEIQSVDDVYENVHSRDNTNTIEEYFSIIKRRVKKNSSSLLDLFEAINFTEATALASRDPAILSDPPVLEKCILHILASSVLAILSKSGVDGVLLMIIDVCFAILSGRFSFHEHGHLMVFDSIVNGTRITSSHWMPPSWIVPIETASPTHKIEQVSFESEMNSVNATMRIDPWLGIANRNVDVYDTLMGALSALCTMTGKRANYNEYLLNYSYLKRQFTEFAKLMEREDVASVFTETIQTLELIRNQDEQTTIRKSILDPAAPRLGGPRATGTSARVDHVTSVPRTKMIKDHLGLGNTKPKTATRKRYRCHICLLEGHQARTCKNMILEENAGRLDTFIKRTIEAGGLNGFVKSLASRSDKAFARAVLQKVRQHARVDIEDLL